MNETRDQHENTGIEIAVIGMAGRFPGAKDIDQFRDNLKNGIQSITFFSREELEALGVEPSLLADPRYVKTGGGILADKEYFDAAFFGYTPREAEVMDPQIRLFHECAWTALENAGYNPEAYTGSIGLYAGASANFNWEALTAASGKEKILGTFLANLLVDKDHLNTQISYKLNLKGPSIAVNSSCSTSLTAVHMACQALLSGECDMALAGGVKISTFSRKGYLYEEGGILSPDGHCRAFDAKAGGTATGEGVGIVVLKSMEDAVEDGDYIHAVIKGSAVNNDGNRKMGYTAPSIEGQAEVITEALHIAGVEPESIGYIEAHGTGTKLGDPIEIEALKLAFGSHKKQFCAIGSVKTNVGHLDSASGITGFIKTVLALKHRQIPPSLHFETANPGIDFENSPFFVNTELREWKREKYPLRAGVSSFGIGGTNAHVVLEEWRAAPPPGKGSRDYHLILLSAGTPSALEKMTENLVNYLEKSPNNFIGPIKPGNAILANAAYTLQVGRKHFSHRRMVTGSTVEEVAEILSSHDSDRVQTHALFTDPGERLPMVFMFPGQGAQYVNMGLELYQKEATFRQEMDRCFDILKPIMGCNIKEILYSSAAASEMINRTEMTQPVIFTFEYALAKLLNSWGLIPYAMIGHSIGEYTAACLAGVFSLEDALALVTLRGRLMQQMPAGAMLSLPLPEEEVLPLLKENLSLAAVNAPYRCVVSGPEETIDGFAREMTAKGYKTTRLHTSHGFHSHMMDPLLKTFEEKVKEVRLNKPGKPYISNVTGQWATAKEAADARYWARHLRRTVRFSDGIKELLKKDDFVFLEVGPGKTLSTFVKQHDRPSGSREKPLAAVNLVRHPKENVSDDYYLINKTGQLWLQGITLDWSGFYGEEKRYRVPLPTYPFMGDAYPVEGDPLKTGETGSEMAAAADRFHVPGRAVSQGKTTEKQGPFKWLVFTGNSRQAQRLMEQLEARGHDAAAVTAGPRFNRLSEKEYSINPGREKDYDLLFAALSPAGESTVDYAPPGDDVQQVLTDIWQQFFGLQQVGIHDDFFELGGDSLKAASVTAAIHKEMNVRVPLAQLFDSPTISQLAEYIRITAAHRYISIEKVEDKSYYAVSPAQKSLYVLQQLDRESTAYNMPLMVVLEGKTGKEKLEEVFKGLIDRHESLRTSFRVVNEEPVQVIHKTAAFSIEYHDLPFIPQFIRPFDLSRAPLLRVGLVEEKEKKYILMVDMHHIISDAASYGVLVRDFIALYRGNPLPPLKLQYKDYSEWWNYPNQRERRKQEERFWLEMFSGTLPMLNIPLDYPRPETRSFEGSSFGFHIGKESTQNLKRLVLQEGVTLQMLMNAIFHILLSKLSGKEDIITGTTAAGRNHADLQGIIGFFVNTLALRSYPSREKTFGDFLTEVRENALKAYENQGYPFENLVETVVVSRDNSRNPIFDILFEIQSGDRVEETGGVPGVEIPGLKIQPYEQESNTTKFDMDWVGVDTGDDISFTVTYCTGLFKEESVQFMAERFIALIESVLNNGLQCKIKELEYSTAIEKELNQVQEVTINF